MKLLVLTYPCSPYRGSEFSVSWNFINHMSQYHELYVLYGTSGNGFGNVSEMNEYLAENPMPNVHFIAVQSPHNSLSTFLAYCRGLNYQFGSYFQYKYWYKQVYKMAKHLVETEKIDIIHYLNPIGFKEPSDCWRIEEIPYVWGPLQAVENRPFALYPSLSLKGKIGAMGRLIMHNTMFVTMPKLHKAMKRADVLLAATPNTAYMIKKFYHRDAIYLPENGIIQMNRITPISYKAGEVLQLIWIGSICERKALIILLEALNLLKNKRWSLRVLGDGELLEQMKKKVDGYGLSERIQFLGAVPRSEVLYKLQSAHLHIISSLGEATTTILWEAMSWAVPTMTLDHCGMAGVVCEKCGIKIPIRSYSQVIREMASQINDILEHPRRIELLSRGVIECSKKFMWNNRAEVFNRLYDKICRR